MSLRRKSPEQGRGQVRNPEGPPWSITHSVAVKSLAWVPEKQAGGVLDRYSRVVQHELAFRIMQRSVERCG